MQTNNNYMDPWRTFANFSGLLGLPIFIDVMLWCRYLLAWVFFLCDLVRLDWYWYWANIEAAGFVGSNCFFLLSIRPCIFMMHAGQPLQQVSTFYDYVTHVTLWLWFCFGVFCLLRDQWSGAVWLNRIDWNLECHESWFLLRNSCRVRPGSYIHIFI